jgi:hypothetical protein
MQISDPPNLTNAGDYSDASFLGRSWAGAGLSLFSSEMTPQPLTGVLLCFSIRLSFVPTDYSLAVHMNGND